MVKKLDQGDKFIQPALIKGKNNVNQTILIEFQKEISIHLWKSMMHPLMYLSILVQM